MKFPWQKDDPLEIEKDKIAAKLVDLQPGDPEREQLMEELMEIIDIQTETRKVNFAGCITPKDIFGGLLTLGLAGMTLHYEQFNVIRSKAVRFWLDKVR